MRRNTKIRKKATKLLEGVGDQSWLVEKMADILARGKEAFDGCLLELGRMLVEAVMYMEREELSGPDYRPSDPTLRKWASQGGSVFVGDQKLKVEHPRLRGSKGEIALKSYGKLKERGAFSEELLGKLLSGLSGRKYRETVVEAGKAFGVSASSVSHRIIEATTKKLKDFKERELSSCQPFAIFIDTVHRGGQAFMVALGIDVEGVKQVLGFWQGATENHDLCQELLSDLERRGLILSNKIIWITDGGSGIIKALKERFGKRLIHVRCMIHKSRNLQRHLAKRYRKEAHMRLVTALKQNAYADAKAMLKDLEKWLRAINESAADSLKEAFDELLTLHRLKVPELLRKSLWTTNPIESMFSMVRDGEGNIKRYRGSKMAQRWLASVLLYCEKRFHKVKGHGAIPDVIRQIESIQDEEIELKKAA